MSVLSEVRSLIAEYEANRPSLHIGLEAAPEGLEPYFVAHRRAKEVLDRLTDLGYEPRITADGEFVTLGGRPFVEVIHG